MSSFRKWFDGKIRRKKHRDDDTSAIPSPAPSSVRLQEIRISSSGSLKESHPLSSSFTKTLEASESFKPQQQVATTSVSCEDGALACVPPFIPPVTDSLVEAGPGDKDCQSTIKPTAQQTPTPSTSQKLWNSAFDSLESDEDTMELVKLYMKTLTTALAAEEAPTTEADDAGLEDPSRRQEYMRKLVEQGQAKVATTSKISKAVGDVAQFALSAKGMIDLAIQNIPQAALPWAGVCAGLQVLLNPAKEGRSNLAGIAHVIARMDWYCALTEILLSKNNIILGHESFEDVVDQLEKAVIALYKALLLYQMKSVCSYYRNQGVVFLRGLLSLENWDGDLKAIVDAETTVQRNAEQYCTHYARSSLGRLVELGEKMGTQLDSLRQELQDLIYTQKDTIWWQKETYMDDKNKKCLRDLHVVNPREDMKTIEGKKDQLLDAAYDWILHTEEYAKFTDWGDGESSPPPCRMLWIKGPAGTGKTMLLIGIIRSLERWATLTAPYLSYFFCQGTDDMTLNTATSALRSLLWLLLVQQPHLLPHLRSKYDNEGSSLFSDRNAFHALSDAFKSILKDPKLVPTYLIVDALDECDEGLAGLIELISTSLTLSDKVKWLVSSRPSVELKNPTTSRMLVEINAQILERPVNNYIQHKLSTLEGREGYDETVLKEISELVCRKANNTFLWVSLVFKQLDSLEGWYAIETLEEIPPGLSELYGHIMARIHRGQKKDPEYCKNVLVAVSLAYRPLSIAELGAVAGLPRKMNPQTIVSKCGSFLTIVDGKISLIHQSAKDYLETSYKSMLQPGHMDMFRHSIDALSELRQNLYSLPNFGMTVKWWAVDPPKPDPLASLRYSSRFWVDHLHDGISQGFELTEELTDDGILLRFLSDHFLHWVECSFFLGVFSSSGWKLILKLLDIVNVYSDASPRLARFLQDAKAFLDSSYDALLYSPLQLYSSCLVFAPEGSEIRKTQFKNRLPFIKDVRNIILGNEGKNTKAHSIARSPDGKLLALAWQHRIALLDIATGKQTLEKDLDQVLALVFSPKSKTLAVGLENGTVQLWGSVTGNCQLILKGHSDQVNAVAFSPNGKMLASASDDHTIRLWDATTGIHQQTINGHTQLVVDVAFSQDSKTLASASYDNTIRLWDAITGVHEQTLDFQASRIAFSPDNNSLAATSWFGTLRFWNRTIDSQILASTSKDQTTPFWVFATDIESTDVCGTIRSLEYLDNRHLRVDSRVFSLDSTGDDLYFDEWRIVRGRNPILHLPSDFQRNVASAAVYSDMVVLGCQDGQVTIIQFDFSHFDKSLMETRAADENKHN